MSLLTIPMLFDLDWDFPSTKNSTVGRRKPCLSEWNRFSEIDDRWRVKDTCPQSQSHPPRPKTDGCSVNFIRCFPFVVDRRTIGMKSVKKDGLSVVQSSREGRLSLFGQRLHSLTETFYSEILDDSQKKMVIKTAQDFEGLQEIRSNDFTFDECSTSEMKSKDDLSFTFRSIDQSQRETHTKNQIQVSNRRGRTEGEMNLPFSRNKPSERNMRQHPIQLERKSFWKKIRQMKQLLSMLITIVVKLFFLVIILLSLINLLSFLQRFIYLNNLFLVNSPDQIRWERWTTNNVFFRRSNQQMFLTIKSVRSLTPLFSVHIQDLRRRLSLRHIDWFSDRAVLFPSEGFLFGQTI